jgi:hypothetical protein
MPYKSKGRHRRLRETIPDPRSQQCSDGIFTIAVRSDDDLGAENFLQRLPETEGILIHGPHPRIPERQRGSVSYGKIIRVFSVQTRISAPRLARFRLQGRQILRCVMVMIPE